MQKINFTTLLSILVSFSAIGQAINKSVEIKGKFENSSHEKIYIKSENFNDSLLTDKLGDLHYKTTKITRPIQADLSIGKRIEFNSYLAPGFALTFTANTENEEFFFNSLHLSGIISKTNQYWKQSYFLIKIS